MTSGAMMGSAPRRTQTAIDLLTASVVRAAASSDPRGVAMAVEGLADAHACLGEALIAARILGTADALRDEIGGAPPDHAARLWGSSRARCPLDSQECRVRRGA